MEMASIANEAIAGVEVVEVKDMVGVVAEAVILIIN
jgi:hypothetical protein